MIAKGLIDTFRASAMFYTAYITRMQYQANLKMSSHESLHWTKQDVSKYEPFAIWHRTFYLCEGEHSEQLQDRKFNKCGESTIYLGFRV